MALRDRIFAMVPSGRPLAVLGGLLAALAVLTVLVVAGSLTGVDQYSVNHWMPWLLPGSPAKTSSAGFWRPFTFHTSNALKLLDLWTYPCSVLISLLVVLGAAFALWRRLGPVAALVPAAAWVVGNGVEVIGKGVITRPALYAGYDRIHVAPFDNSFPSGHNMRCVILGYAIVLVWRRAWPWVVAWGLLVAPALVAQSAHTTTDVIGGALVGLILLVLMLSVVQRQREDRLARE